MRSIISSEIVSNVSSSRSDNSLFVLTQRFVEYIKNCYPQPIDTKEASKYLGISKRRICDITNIFEGLGLLRRHSVNNMVWTGGSIDKYYNTFEDMNEWNKEKMMMEENQIDIQIDNVSEKIEKFTEDKKCVNNSFVTYKDLLKIGNDNEMIVFAIKAPVDTFVENKKMNTGHVLELVTKEGKIDVFYVSDKNVA